MPSGIPDSPGSAGGASGSVDFGGASGLREELRQATEGGSGQGVPGGQPAAAPQAGGAPPAQAAPPALGAPDAQPPSALPGQVDYGDGSMYNEVFSPPRQATDVMPWREILQMWATHPKAGPALRHLAEIANRDRRG